MRLIPRIQTQAVRRALSRFPVVAVLGARQVGKSTLVRELLGQKRAFFALDDPAVLLAAEENPVSFLKQAPRMTLDEVQKCPALFPALKLLVDENRQPGRFLLTGSANPLLLAKISETLAGRIVFVDMPPLTLFETRPHTGEPPLSIRVLACKTARAAWLALNRLPHGKDALASAAWRGGLPPAWLEPDEPARQTWFKGYVRTYLERDVRDISRIQRLHDFQKFLGLSAFRCGQILNRAELARDTGVSYTTVSNFFDLLLATFQIFLVEPYFRNVGKRLIKSPKLMWNDTGLAAHLMGLHSWEEAERLGRSPFLAENRVAIELKALLEIRMPLARLFYWRTSGGAEVDLLVRHRERLIPIEVKWREKIHSKELSGLKSFLKDMGSDAPWGICLYRGRELLKAGEKLFLVPLDRFLS